MPDVPNNSIGGGLSPLPEDNRDFKFGSLFTLPKLSELPHEYLVPSAGRIKDQGSSDLCTAFAVTSVSEDQEAFELSPEYQFMKTKVLDGDPESWGADMRSACKAAVKFGSLPASSSPVRLAEHGRAAVVDPLRYPSFLDEAAKEYAKGSFLTVTGPYDLFDNIRATLWATRDEKRSAVTGAPWRDAWTVAPKGVVPKTYPPNTPGGHAFKLRGYVERNGEAYLVAQLSSGVSIGDEGYFYFPRDVVNREFYATFTFTDKVNPDEAKFLTKYELNVQWIALAQAAVALANFFLKLKNLKNL